MREHEDEPYAVFDPSRILDAFDRDIPGLVAPITY